MHKRTDDEICHCHECREERHKLAWRLYKKGMNQCDIAEVLGVTGGAVSQWINKAKQEGPEALNASPRPGAEPKMTDEQLEQLDVLLQEGAKAYGFQGDVWTSRRVKKLVKAKFEVEYTERRINQLLKEMGYSWQKPERKSRERNEEEVQKWVKETWPEIKKKPARTNE